MNKMLFLWVGLGGLIGSIARYYTSALMMKILPFSFPFGTFTVNIAGCLLIGLFFGWGERFSWMTPEMRIFLTTGFCGGFTTFSTFAFENLFLLQTAEYGLFALYSLISFATGLGAVLAGAYLAKISF
jgi:CrcB protein